MIEKLTEFGNDNCVLTTINSPSKSQDFSHG